jgi:plasmid stabilization system protein ParE
VKRARFIAGARREFLAEVGYYEEAAEAGTRRVFVKGFPFSIFYRPDRDGIIVFAVAHQARQPGYWRSRTR